jgi:phage minor structural protein
MIPILFTENTKVFTSNGVGRLSDIVSCVCNETLNGEYEIEAEYPITGAHYSDITIRSIIGVMPAPEKSIQPFRIYRISKPINGIVTINACHISYDLTKNTTMPFSVSASSSACNSTLQGLKNNAVETCDFTFWTDVTTIAAYSQTIPSAIRQRLGGIAGSVLDQFGGEYEWDGYTVKLHRNRGTLKNIPLRYGKNITDINQETEISKTITGIVPFWVDNEGNNLVTLPEKAVYSPNASRYSEPLTVPMDFSGNYEEAPSVAVLRAAAQAYVAQSNIGIPKVSTKVSFVDLKDTEEYKDIAPLQQLYLADSIPVTFEPLGVETRAKVIEVKFDVLKEKYDSITLGSVKADMSTAITDVTASINSLAERTRMNFSQMDDNIDEAINNATAWLTSSGGYVIAVKNSDGSWKELLFMDTDDVSTAINVLRINENGIGFSSNGVGGPYAQGWTIDGRILIGGTNAPSLTVYDNQNNILFQADATKIIWNAANSSMDSSGTLKASSAQLTDASFSGGSISMHTNTNLDLRIASGRIDFEPDTANESSIYPSGSNGLEIESDGLRLQTKTAGTGYKGIEMWQGSNNPFTIISNSSALELKTGSGSNINIESGQNVNISGDYISLESVSGVQVATKIQAYDPSSILIGDDPEIRFYDGMDNYTDNITLEGDCVIMEADEIVVRSSRGAGQYKKGYTGTFNVETSGGGTTTLTFMNGILI